MMREKVKKGLLQSFQATLSDWSAGKVTTTFAKEGSRWTPRDAPGRTMSWRPPPWSVSVLLLFPVSSSSVMVTLDERSIMSGLSGGLVPADERMNRKLFRIIAVFRALRRKDSRRNRVSSAADDMGGPSEEMPEVLLLLISVVHAAPDEDEEEDVASVQLLLSSPLAR